VAVEAVLLAYERTRDVALLNVVEKSFARYRGRRSRYFDDDGWYLNAWLRAYDVTGDPKYLAEGRSLFETLTHGWDDHCGGGVWWSAERNYKNAITNELFLLAAARLARRTGLPRYVAWALRCWRWFGASGMINADDLVNDGLDGHCANNGQPTWTYNQGVILGGLVELHRITGDVAHLDQARRIAAAAMRTLVHNGHGVLREQLDGFGNRDAHAFKGVLAQGLARLYAADPDANQAVKQFLIANAEAVADAGVADFGVGWLGGSGPVNAASRASAALLLNSVDLLEVARATGPVGLGEAVGPPPVDGVRFEAEEAELVQVGTEAIHQGYTGTGYVAGWHRDGQRVEFVVGTGGTGRIQTGRRDVDLADVHRPADDKLATPTPPGASTSFGASTTGGVSVDAVTPGEDSAAWSEGVADDNVKVWRTVTLRYAAEAGDAYRTIVVDGVVCAERLLFTATSSWNEYSTVSLDVKLRIGARIQVRLDASRGGRNYLNLDSLTVR
jgi:predicted alpha-1,6-mannanase (GH76 family)